MSYPFVAGIPYGKRAGPVKAFVIHMAEGGGTVGFLRNDATPPPRGVSVHYVVEYTGRIVQMVQESQASGSINPNDIRTTDDPDGFYGATAAKAVMGSWWKNPNAAAITVEVEGFAKTGPNASQHGSLKTLIADVRSRYPDMGLLGHRDFADYKACPGKLVHWDDFGGHGPAKLQGDTDMGLPLVNFKAAPGSAAPKADGKQHAAIQLADRELINIAAGVSKPVIGTADIAPDADWNPGLPVYVLADAGPFEMAAFLQRDVDFKAAPVVAADCTAAVSAAKAAEHERTKALALSAVSTI